MAHACALLSLLNFRCQVTKHEGVGCPAVFSLLGLLIVEAEFISLCRTQTGRAAVRAGRANSATSLVQVELLQATSVAQR